MRTQDIYQCEDTHIAPLRYADIYSSIYSSKQTLDIYY